MSKKLKDFYKYNINNYMHIFMVIYFNWSVEALRQKLPIFHTYHKLIHHTFFY